MTRRTILAALCAMLLAAALPIPRACPGGAHAQDFSPKPFHELAQRVTDRYEGRLIAVRMMPPTPHERELGAALVYEFRLLTPHRNLLVICLMPAPAAFWRSRDADSCRPCGRTERTGMNQEMTTECGL